MNDLDVDKANKSTDLKELSDVLRSAITSTFVSFHGDHNVTSVAPTTSENDNITGLNTHTDAETTNSTQLPSLHSIANTLSLLPPTLPATTAEPDRQALLYVSAIVLFYGAVLLTLLWMQLRRHAVPPADEELYAVLINREELARRDTLIRHKLNVLRIDGIKDGYLLDHIPEHTV